jgi:hypothetical protein
MKPELSKLGKGVGSIESLLICLYLLLEDQITSGTPCSLVEYKASVFSNSRVGLFPLLKDSLGVRVSSAEATVSLVITLAVF